MEKKKILILLILFVAIGGLTVSSVVATKTYQTGKLYFKDKSDGRHSSFPTMKIDSKRKNKISGFYVFPKNKNTQMNPNTVFVEFIKNGGRNYPDYKITKTVITFKKTVNGKTEYSSKTIHGNEVIYEPKNIFKPYYCIVHYKKSMNLKFEGAK